MLGKTIAHYEITAKLCAMPGQDTGADKVLISPVTRNYQTESLGLSPDGDMLVFSAMYNRRQLMLAENFKLGNWE